MPVQALLNRGRFNDPIARGLAMAGCAHGLGTAAIASEYVSVRLLTAIASNLPCKGHVMQHLHIWPQIGPAVRVIMKLGSANMLSWQSNPCACQICQVADCNPLLCSEPEALPFCALAYALIGVTATTLVAIPPVRYSLLAIASM